MGGGSGAAAFLRGLAMTEQLTPVDKEASYMSESMKRDDEMLRYEFPPGEEPTVYTTDVCAEVGHERTLQGN
jgi:hypothetical protein